MTSLRFGIVVPWMNRTVEDELPTLVQNRNISLHWSRALPCPLPTDRDDESYLPRLLADVPAAIERLAPSDLKAVIVACTSASLVPPLQPGPCRGIRVVWAYQCLKEALAEGGNGPILLCAPYSERATDLLANQLRGSGYPIATVARIDSQLEYRDIPTSVIAATIAAAWKPSVERILISCTALYTSMVPVVLECDFGIDLPTVSSVSAIASFINKEALQ